MEHKTEVTVRQTTIKYFNENSNEVNEISVVGKLNISECKKYVSENELGLFITKTDNKETFEVDTVQLLQLR